MCVFSSDVLRGTCMYITQTVPTACLPTPSAGHSCQGWDWPKCGCASWFKMLFFSFNHISKGLLHEEDLFSDKIPEVIWSIHTDSLLRFCPQPTILLWTQNLLQYLPFYYKEDYVFITRVCIQSHHQCALPFVYHAWERADYHTHVPPLKLCQHPGESRETHWSSVISISSYTCTLHIKRAVCCRLKDGERWEDGYSDGLFSLQLLLMQVIQC